MFARLLLLFTIIPIVELFVLIPLGSQIGVLPTVAIIVATGVLGAWLGKKQGIEAFRRIQTDLASGKLPGDAITDGILILIACTLLVTPGVLTDAVGLALLIPPARRPLKALLRKRFTKMLQSPNVTVIDVSSSFSGQTVHRTNHPDVIDITPAEERAYTLVD